MDAKSDENSVYSAILKRVGNTKEVKILTGIRGCGKSTIMEDIQTELTENGVDESSIKIFDLESPEYLDIKTWESLAEIIFHEIPKEERTYVFFEEIQHVKGWERVVSALISGTNSDVFITSSDRKILNAEKTQYLSKKCVFFEMIPDFDIYENIKNIYASIITYDILPAGQIRNIDEFNKLMRYIMINATISLSLNKIVKDTGFSRELVERYLSLMYESYLIERSERIDILLNKTTPSCKYYAGNMEFFNIFVTENEYNKLNGTKNEIYLKLKSLNYSLKTGKLPSGDVDFIATHKNGGVRYYAVNETVDELPLKILKSIKNEYPKYLIVTNGSVNTVTKDGINIISVDYLN